MSEKIYEKDRTLFYKMQVLREDEYEEIKNKRVETLKEEEKLKFAIETLKRNNIEDIDPTELKDIGDRVLTNYKDLAKLAKILLYIKYRFALEYNRADAYRKTFNEQLSEIRDDKEANRRAKLLENSALFNKIYRLFGISAYVAFAFERIEVLREAYRISMDNTVNIRERSKYMDIFLKYTDKPEEGKVIEDTSRVNESNEEIKEMKKMLKKVANKLDGVSAEGLLSLKGE